ncbi:MAG: glutamate formimidoyltransferase [Chloroflexi bacterium]|nr:MAG: glutamate formimidoyltransferase [Chloroflexota bacterium]
MTNQLVECIANYSEARRPEVVDAIAEAIISVPGVRFLDRHTDLDHNRTVLTFVGPPEGVEEAAFRSIAKAKELIDLDQHKGEHPRIGAADVVPFVPISGVSMEECVEIARRLGSRVGNELEIPVYLYEEAATRPERQNLENIRRGQYEALKEEMGLKPERDPDFGPKRVGPAGATVIGARYPLIAYNVYLTTDDVSVAKKIAKAVRHSSGGLRYVKGLGLLVEGRAQVSMNLTNFRETPIARVVEFIRREAERYGVSIHHSELVGLIPEEALVDAAVWYLQMDQFELDQILERKLYTQEQPAVELQTPESPESFLNDLASGTPTPGGGAAAAYTGAEAAALAAMVARVTIGKKKYASVETQMQAIMERADRLRSTLYACAERDSAAFNEVMEAFKLPKNTQEEQEIRKQAVEDATLKAIWVPMDVARGAVEAMELALEAAQKGNVTAISDAVTGASLARAALAGAGYNVRINANSISDKTSIEPYLNELVSLENRADETHKLVLEQFEERGGISLK